MGMLGTGNETGASRRWPWAVLAAASAWVVLVRVPLVLNAASHLDSDLAVDGLTLLDATRGHWRWHYPGTPFMGIGPVFLSLPQALRWGADPVTLVSGGVVAFVGLVLATFLLGWRAFGPVAAAWSLAPLAFASVGPVWLSGRITGGHLVAAAWHAGAFAGLAACLDRGGRTRSAALGVWCGLGLALDSMFAVTLAALVPTAVASWLAAGASRRGLTAAVVFAAALVVGASPRPLGARLDPYDAYRDQFAVASEPKVLADHGWLLATQCLPRLFCGHRLPGLETDPDPGSLSGLTASRSASGVDPLAAGVVGITLTLTAASVAGLGRAMFAGRSPATRAVASGLALSALATLAGFVVNRNIYNSDNYRYLVGLLVPWSTGYGVLMDWLVRKGRTGATCALGAVFLLALLMTADLSRWYARFGWVDARGWPVRHVVDDPTLDWLNAHPEVHWIEGGYWDVYRLAFLTGGRVKGAPFPIYPNRFPEWRRARGGGRALVVRPTPEGRAFGEANLRAGGKVVFRGRGVSILAGP